MEIVDRATSYTECTVSGTGLRVIGYGSGKYVHRKQKLPNSGVEVESYSNASRYIVITGKPLASTWPHLADIGYMLDDLVAELDGQNNNDNAFDTAREQRKSSDDAGADTTFSRMTLPEELQRLIFNGPAPNEDHSRVFHHAVCWLCEFGWSATRIEAFIAGKPIVPCEKAWAGNRTLPAQGQAQNRQRWQRTGHIGSYWPNGRAAFRLVSGHDRFLPLIRFHQVVSWVRCLCGSTSCAG
jgi:hypothetical protein